MKSVKEVKKLIAEIVNKKSGISTSIWQSDSKDDIDRIVIKFPRDFDDYLGITYLKEKVLDKNGFHVAQIMGFMEAEKLWLLLVRDRRK